MSMELIKEESTIDNRRDLISQHTRLFSICPRHKMLQMKSGLLTVEMPHLTVEFGKQDAGKQWWKQRKIASGTVGKFREAFLLLFLCHYGHHPKEVCLVDHRNLTSNIWDPYRFWGKWFHWNTKVNLRYLRNEHRGTYYQQNSFNYCHHNVVSKMYYVLWALFLLSISINIFL